MFNKDLKSLHSLHTFTGRGEGMGSPIKMTGLIVKVLFITGNKQTNETGKRFQYHVLWASQIHFHSFRPNYTSRILGTMVACTFFARVACVMQKSYTTFMI